MNTRSFLTILCLIFLGYLFLSPATIYATSVTVTGKAKAINTDNSYLDFTSTYNSNVQIDNSNGNFSGYAFSEDLGWVAFGTTDNSSGPVNLNLTTGAVTGKAKVINSEAYLDFTGYNSSVTTSIPAGAFTGYVFSEDLGWINFGDTGVSTSSSFDTSAPSISLTALSPDPNTDNTPTLSGTATESVGTVSNVQFQMDATSGSWTACTAADGSFNSASEAFSCTASTLTDGSHTIYVRATDSNSNTTSNASASTDTFTIDITAPASFDLDSPGNDSYTNNERPTFKWKATTDATSGLSSYSLEVDNGDTGDFSITGIPTSRTTDYDTSKYLVHYDNFSDADSTNNYISIYTKSSSSWGTEENDGKLKEGSRTWTIKAVDNAGNERSQSRVVIVDLTNPVLSSLSVSDSAGSKDGYQLVISQNPQITGTIADNLAPDKVEVSVFKENYFLGIITSKELFTSLTYSLSNSTNQKSLSFSIPVQDSLDFGSYEVTVKGQDKAGNKSATSTIYLKILTTNQARELLQGKLSETENKTMQEQAQVSLPRLEEKARERRVKEAAELEKTISPIAKCFDDLKLAMSDFASGVRLALQHTLQLALNGLSFLASVTQQFATSIATIVREVDIALGRSADYTQQEIARVYKNMQPMVDINQILRPLADTAILIRGDIGQRLEDGGQMLAKISTNTLAGIKNTSISSEENTRKAFNNYYSGASKTLGAGISSLAFGVGEKVQNVSDGAGFTIVKFGYLFVNEPTIIYDVQTIVISPTSTKITWKTNHPASGKVNYGLDETYPLDIQTTKRTTNHEFTLTNLTPNTEYSFEVMSQNKNYVYDANRKFKTAK